MSEIRDFTIDDVVSGDGDANEDPLSRYPTSLPTTDSSTAPKKRKTTPRKRKTTDVVFTPPTAEEQPPQSSIKDFILDEDDDDGNASTNTPTNASYIEGKVTPKRGRAKGKGPGRKPGTGVKLTGVQATNQRMKKLREKHLRKTTSNASQLIERVLSSGVKEDFTNLHSETARLRHECLQTATALRPLLEASTNFSNSVSKLSERLRKSSEATANESAIDSALLFEFSELANRQTNQFVSLSTRLNRLFSLYSDNLTKVEAMARFAVDRYNGNFNPAAFVAPQTPPQQQQQDETQPSSLDSTPPIVEEPSSPQNASTVTVPAAPPPEESSSSSAPPKFGLGIRVGPDGNAAFSLSTRVAPQIIRGEPGATWVNVSFARDKVTMHSRAQSEDMRRLNQVQRLAIEKQRKRKFASIYTPTDAPLLLQQSSENDQQQRLQTLADQQAIVAREIAVDKEIRFIQNMDNPRGY